jgi:hypothetical protein
LRGRAIRLHRDDVRYSSRQRGLKIWHVIFGFEQPQPMPIMANVRTVECLEIYDECRAGAVLINSQNHGSQCSRNVVGLKTKSPRCLCFLPLVLVDIRRNLPSACHSCRIAKCNFSLDSLDVDFLSSKECSFILRVRYFAQDISGLDCSRSSRGMYWFDSGVSQGGPQTLLYLNHFRASATTISGGSVVTLSAPASCT